MLLERVNAMFVERGRLPRALARAWDRLCVVEVDDEQTELGIELLLTAVLGAVLVEPVGDVARDSGLQNCSKMRYIATKC